MKVAVFFNKEQDNYLIKISMSLSQKNRRWWPITILIHIERDKCVFTGFFLMMRDAALFSFLVGFTGASGPYGLPRDPWSQGET